MKGGLTKNPMTIWYRKRLMYTNSLMSVRIKSFGAFHLSELAGQTGHFTDGIHKFEGLVIR